MLADLSDSHNPGEYQAVVVLLGILTADAGLRVQMMGLPATGSADPRPVFRMITGQGPAC
jgi:hypothetical protein